MQFELTEEQQLVKANMKEFCEKYVEPVADEIDREERFPAENIKRLAEQDMLGVPYPEEYGGAGSDYLTYVMTVEELARACASTGFVVETNTSLACFSLFKYGSEDQKKKYLAPLCRGDALGAFALDEQGAGREAAPTTAVPEGDLYVLSGVKTFVMNAPVAGTFIVFADVAKSGGGGGPSAFIVPAGAPGMEVGKPVSKMGARGAPSSEVVLKGCRIPKENLLGREGQGPVIAGAALDSGRIGMAALALGIAQAALEESVRYSKERVQFGQPICNFQAIQWMIANMGTEIEVCRYLTYYAAWCYDQGLPYSEEAAMAKLMASETAVHQSDRAVQIHGGIGTVKGQKVERLYRDAKITQIHGGTPEFTKMVIADSVLGRPGEFPSGLNAARTGVTRLSVQ
jgi:butyryl-CoA dehydrogenase